MDKFFSMFGKVILGAMLLAFVLGIGYYVGTAKNKSELAPTPSPKPTTSLQIDTAKIQPTVFPTETPLPTKEVVKKTLSGGLSGATSFSNYSIQIPGDWIDKKEVTPGVIDKLTLSKDDYDITILQAAIGGGGCLYKDEPDQMMAQRFSDFVDITTKVGDFRRGWNTDAKAINQTYTICQKGSDGSYGGPTSVGAISYTTPKNPNETILSEMDNIITSLKKQ